VEKRRQFGLIRFRVAPETATIASDGPASPHFAETPVFSTNGLIFTFPFSALGLAFAPRNFYG
jgi:hypothetical protein